MRETLKKQRTDMAAITDVRRSRDVHETRSRMPMLTCKSSLFAEGFTNKSRMKNVKVFLCQLVEI